MLGALLASGFYALIKYLNYEEVNGDQDKSQDEEKILDMAKTHRAGGGQNAPVERNGPRGSHHSHRSHHSSRPVSNQRQGEDVSHYQEYRRQNDGPPQL